MSEDDVALRMVVYYEAIGPALSEASWGTAVKACVARCKFYPTVAELIEAGTEAPKPEVYVPEWREQRRALMARNAQRQLEAPKEEWTPEPPRPATVTAHEDRMELLRKQAEQLRSES